ncbi:type VII toxin-antitoxin system MntA family adenylyltransferase antitoxin [Rhodoflexus caldus]|uniref:type VII toxin-antitoxin system MntA family adenylyltransferase antitoxin n=1 Tax=Rhodoflexus caldus TaxID=2891236 RepID=UPI00202A602C|nr:nucleotidyltransferase family protein [Rhodoflexus caldus]
MTFANEPFFIPAFRSYFKDKPVKEVYLFGSYARGEADENSDIDLLVRLDYSQIRTGLEFFSMWDELEKMTGKKVDFVSVNALSPYVREFVNRDKILIYEKRKARRLHKAAAYPRRNRRGTKIHQRLYLSILHRRRKDIFGNRHLRLQKILSKSSTK